MTDREYLRSLGFTVGERGRYSKEMLEALRNREKSETDNLINDMNDYLGLPARVPTREAQELYGLTAEGNKVGFIICQACAEHMMWCECTNGVMAPSIVVTLTGAAKTIARLHNSMLQS